MKTFEEALKEIKFSRYTFFYITLNGKLALDCFGKNLNDLLENQYFYLLKCEVIRIKNAEEIGYFIFDLIKEKEEE
jgi:hypothetical protein